MVETVSHMLVEMHVHDLVFTDIWLFNPRVILDECSIRAKWLSAHITYHIFTLSTNLLFICHQKDFVWNGSHIALNHPFHCSLLELIF